MTTWKPCEPDELLHSLRVFSGFECRDEDKPLAEAEATCVDDFMTQFGIDNQRTAEAVDVTSQTVRKWRKSCGAVTMDNACKLISYFAGTDEYAKLVSFAPDSLKEIIEHERGEIPASMIDMLCFQFMERAGTQRRREALWGASDVENLTLHELLSMASCQLDVRERRIIGRMMATMIESNKSGRATSADVELAGAYMGLTDNMSAELDSLAPHVTRALEAMEETSKEVNSYLRHVKQKHELARAVDDLRETIEGQQAEIDKLAARIKELTKQRDDKQREIHDLNDELTFVRKPKFF